MNSLSKTTQTSKYNWTDIKLPSLPFWKRMVVQRAAGEALLGLAILGAVGTAYVGIAFTATPIVIICTFCALAVYTLAATAGGLYLLCKTPSKNDPDLCRQKASRAGNDIVNNHLGYEQICHKYGGLLEEKKISLDALHQLLHRDAQKLTFVQFKAKHGGGSVYSFILPETRTILKSKYLEYIQQEAKSESLLASIKTGDAVALGLTEQDLLKLSPSFLKKRWSGMPILEIVAKEAQLFLAVASNIFKQEEIASKILREAPDLIELLRNCPAIFIQKLVKPEEVKQRLEQQLPALEQLAPIHLATLIQCGFLAKENSLLQAKIVQFLSSYAKELISATHPILEQLLHDQCIPGPIVEALNVARKNGNEASSRYQQQLATLLKQYEAAIQTAKQETGFAAAQQEAERLDGIKKHAEKAACVCAEKLQKLRASQQEAQNRLEKLLKRNAELQSEKMTCTLKSHEYHSLKKVAGEKRCLEEALRQVEEELKPLSRLNSLRAELKSLEKIKDLEEQIKVEEVRHHKPVRGIVQAYIHRPRADLGALKRKLEELKASQAKRQQLEAEIAKLESKSYERVLERQRSLRAQLHALPTIDLEKAKTARKRLKAVILELGSNEAELPLVKLDLTEKAYAIARAEVEAQETERVQLHARENYRRAVDAELPYKVSFEKRKAPIDAEYVQHKREASETCDRELAAVIAIFKQRLA